jgi:hypothetical protein
MVCIPGALENVPGLAELEKSQTAGREEFSERAAKVAEDHGIVCMV